MNFFSWTLALSLLILVLLKGAEYHRALVCRQESWQMSFDLGTRALFPKSLPIEKTFHKPCNVIFIRKEGGVSWQRPLSIKRSVFHLGLKGSL